jgi:hypothetical protein
MAKKKLDYKKNPNPKLKNVDKITKEQACMQSEFWQNITGVCNLHKDQLKKTSGGRLESGLRPPGMSLSSSGKRKARLR